MALRAGKLCAFIATEEVLPDTSCMAFTDPSTPPVQAKGNKLCLMSARLLCPVIAYRPLHYVYFRVLLDPTTSPYKSTLPCSATPLEDPVIITNFTISSPGEKNEFHCRTDID